MTEPSVKHQCSVDSNIKYKDIISTIRIIYRENGLVGGFTKGMLPRVLCNAPSAAISWGTYEIMKHILTNDGKCTTSRI
jgi:hypothetical protein